MNNKQNSNTIDTSEIINGQPFNLLVLVDSSSTPFHFTDYAVKIAKAQNGLVHLYYITELIHLPESYNPLEISEWLSESYRQAKMSLERIKRFIEDRGVNISSTESAVGNASLLLQMKVESTLPGLIVVGQGSLSPRVIGALVKRSTCPVLIVPEKDSQVTLLSESIGYSLESLLKSNRAGSLEFN